LKRQSALAHAHDALRELVGDRRGSAKSNPARPFDGERRFRSLRDQPPLELREHRQDVRHTRSSGSRLRRVCV
jgi:hypothetical protein